MYITATLLAGVHVSKWLGVLLQDPKGKGKWRAIDDELDGILALDVPLELLGKPICKRSSAHLEAALHLIEVRSAPCSLPQLVLS